MLVLASRASRNNTWDNALLITFALASVVAAAAAAAAPDADDRRLRVIFAPWTSDARAIAMVGEAGGRALEARGASVVVASDEAGLARRLRDAGAWFVVKASPGGCVAPAERLRP